MADKNTSEGTGEAGHAASEPLSLVPIGETRFAILELDESLSALWVCLKHSAPVCFSQALVADLRKLQQSIAANAGPADSDFDTHQLKYLIFTSRIPGVFSLGGDLALFHDLVLNRDRDSLTNYARECVEMVYANAIGHGLPITTVSLVQGSALGGGFEAALAAQIVVAERQAKMGFPEILFNMFPGMGAYTLLRRRVSRSEAERIIMGGASYTAEQLYGMGIVDVLADEGMGRQAVADYLRRHYSRARGVSAFRRAVQTASPVDHEELIRVVDVWVDCAMALTPRDLKVMSYLVQSQHKMAGAVAGPPSSSAE